MLSQLSHPSLPRLEVSCPPETFLTITRRFNHIFLPIHIYLTPPAGMI